MQIQSLSSVKTFNRSQFLFILRYVLRMVLGLSLKKFNMIETSAILKDRSTDYFVIPETQFFLKEKQNESLTYTDLELIVTDSETGKVIPKAMVSIDSINRTAVCDQQGRTVLQEVIAGEFMLDVIIWGYSAHSSKVRLSPRDLNTLHIKMVRNS